MARHRRKKSRRKKSSSTGIQTKRRTSSVGANFVAFVLGMLTTVILVVWGYAAITAEPVAANESPKSRDMNNGALGQNYDEVEALLESDDISKMRRKLLELNDWPRSAELPVRVSANRKREKMAKKMLRTNGLSEPDRVFAVESLIESLSAIYGLDLFYRLNDQSIADQLRDVAEKHLDDSSVAVVRAARLAMLKYHAFEYVKYRDTKPEHYAALEESLLATLKAEPNQAFSLSNVKLVFKSLSRLNRDVSLKLIDLLMKRRGEFAGTKTEQLIADLADSSILLEARYEAMFENRWVNGSAGREQLFRTSIELVENQDAGQTVLEQVDRVAQWFEQTNKYDRATDIYQAMLDFGDRPDNPTATKTAQLLGGNGLTRCNALGQPVRFSGVDIKGRPLSSGRFSGRIVAVIFWSTKDEQSKRELIQLHKEKRQYSSLPCEVLAVCLEGSPGQEFGKLAGQLVRFQFIDPDKNGPEGVPFTKQVPVTRVPHILLIDQTGRLSDTNVPSDNLRSHIEHLATKR